MMSLILCLSLWRAGSSLVPTVVGDISSLATQPEAYFVSFRRPETVVSCRLSPPGMEAIMAHSVNVLERKSEIVRRVTRAVLS